MTRPRVRHTTVPRGRTASSTIPPRRPSTMPPPRPALIRTVTEPETSLLDVIDSLLNKGVVLNADVILALADVDLVYLRLSALLCAADRIADQGAGRVEQSRRAKIRSSGSSSSRNAGHGTRITRTTPG